MSNSLDPDLPGLVSNYLQRLSADSLVGKVKHVTFQKMSQGS